MSAWTRTLRDLCFLMIACGLGPMWLAVNVLAVAAGGAAA